MFLKVDLPEITHYNLKFVDIVIIYEKIEYSKILLHAHVLIFSWHCILNAHDIFYKVVYFIFSSRESTIMKHRRRYVLVFIGFESPAALNAGTRPVYKQFNQAREIPLLLPYELMVTVQFFVLDRRVTPPIKTGYPFKCHNQGHINRTVQFLVQSVFFVLSANR